MIRSIKIGIIAVAALLLAWVLPWFYTFLFAQPSSSPFTLYSCVTHCFASLAYDEGGRVVGRDFNGKTYTSRQFDSILPMFYYRQLVAEGRFPRQIEGVEIDMQDAERSGFIFRNSPGEVNRRKPGIYQLLESAPARVEFQTPPDVFRIADEGIEFVDMESNTLDAKKSARFTRALQKAGFAFPARIVAGNASTRKEYDNGYLIVDSRGQLFQLKQVRGRARVVRAELPDGVDVRHLFVTEFSDRKLLGLLTDSENRLYGIDAEEYALHEIPVGGFDPTREAIMIIGDMFYWTVTLQGMQGERLIAVNARDYTRADEYRPEAETERWERCMDYLFPFRLSFTSPLDGYVRPRVGGWSPLASGLGLLLALVYLAASRRSWRGRTVRAVGVVLFGLYLFIPMLAFGELRRV